MKTRIGTCSLCGGDVMSWRGNWFSIYSPEPSKCSRCGARPAGDVSDLINHPPHYTSHPSGIECIEITRHMCFNLGNAFKYIWRAGLKDDAVQELRKAIWYLEDEIMLREGAIKTRIDTHPGPRQYFREVTK